MSTQQENVIKHQHSLSHYVCTWSCMFMNINVRSKQSVKTVIYYIGIIKGFFF